MRLNTQNLLALAALIVLAGVLIFIGTREAAAPVVDDVETGEGALLPEIDTSQLTRFEVRSFPQAADEPDTTEEAPAPDEAVASQAAEVVIERNEEGLWNITQATNATERGTDQATVQGVVDIVASLTTADNFTLDEGQTLAAFGLDEPRYEIVLAGPEETHQLLLGDKNPAQTRYYVQLADDADVIYTVVSDILDNVVLQVQEPPYVPPPTPTPMPTNTPNPISEVGQTQTAQAAVDSTATAQADMISTPVPAGPDGPDEASTEEAQDQD